MSVPDPEDQSYLCTLKFFVDNWPCYSMNNINLCPDTLAHERKHLEQWQALVASLPLDISDLQPIPLSCVVMDPAVIGDSFKQSLAFRDLYDNWLSGILYEHENDRCEDEAEAYQAEAAAMAESFKKKFGTMNCTGVTINRANLSPNGAMSNCSLCTSSP